MLSDDALQRAADRYNLQAHGRARVASEIALAYRDGTINDELLAAGWEVLRKQLIDTGSMGSTQAAYAQQVQTETRAALVRVTEVLDRAVRVLERTQAPPPPPPRNRDRLLRWLEGLFPLAPGRGSL